MLPKINNLNHLDLSLKESKDFVRCFVFFVCSFIFVPIGEFHDVLKWCQMIHCFLLNCCYPSLKRSRIFWSASSLDREYDPRPDESCCACGWTDLCTWLQKSSSSLNTNGYRLIYTAIFFKFVELLISFFSYTHKNSLCFVFHELFVKYSARVANWSTDLASL